MILLKETCMALKGKQFGWILENQLCNLMEKDDKKLRDVYV